MKNLFFLSIFLLVLPVYAQEQQAQLEQQINDHSDSQVIRIYQDADLSNHIESSEAIQKGIEVAFDEVDNQIAGYKIEFKYLDHRGNVVRSKQNYERFLADPQALVIYSGIHSPPLIKNRSFINENNALTLVPWAAGGPITRYPSSENWVFRLSVDDTRAGPIMVDYAIKEKQCRTPHLLLEATHWGDSNLKSMSKALGEHGISIPSVTRFGWNLRDQGARIMLRKIIASGSDCAVLVANTVEGKVIAQAMIDLPAELRIPIISHWGITGGDFHEKMTAEKRDMLDLSFIQSCFAFTNTVQNDFSKLVFNRLKKITEDTGNPIEEVNDLKSAVGFIHAYDLTKLLIQAIMQVGQTGQADEVGLTGNINIDRNSVRLALESLNTSVQGLIKMYDKPFSVFDPESNVNAHEALHSDNFCMARYGTQDEILIIQPIHK